MKEELEQLAKQDIEKAYAAIKRMMADPDQFAALPLQDRKYIVRLEETLREKLKK